VVFLAEHNFLPVGEQSRRAVCGSVCTELQCWALGVGSASRESETRQQAIVLQLVNSKHSSTVIKDIPRNPILCSLHRTFLSILTRYNALHVLTWIRVRQKR